MTAGTKPPMEVDDKCGMDHQDTARSGWSLAGGIDVRAEKLTMVVQGSVMGIRRRNSPRVYESVIRS